MNTQKALSILMICSVSLTIGCARVNDPASKKPAVKPDAVTTPDATSAPTPGAQSDVKITAAGSIANEEVVAGSASTENVSGDSISADPLAGGSLSDLSGGSMSAEGATDVEEIVVVAPISTQQVLSVIERMKLPIILPFSLPKYDEKDAVKSFVGLNCDKEILASRKVKSASNIVAQLAKDLCYTNVLRRGKITLVVVPKKLIDRKVVVGNVERRYQVVLRPDSSVSSFREVITTKTSKGTETITKVAMMNANGVFLSSVVDSKSTWMFAEASNGAFRYEAKSETGNGKVMSAKKSLEVRNYQGKGIALTVIEDTPTSNPADITCNLIAIRTDLETLMSKTIEGRCFHRH